MKKKLVEQEGMDIFLEKISETWPDSVYVMQFIDDFIKKSGCQRIEFGNFKYPAHGVSLYDRVILNYDLLDGDLTFFLYTLFHEIAHQYQYKKYGMDVMYACYTGDISVSEGAKKMKYYEHVADDFSVRKLRELKKHSDKIKVTDHLIKKVYENISVFHFEKLILFFIEKIKAAGIKDKKDISEILYNNVIKQVNVGT